MVGARSMARTPYTGSWWRMPGPAATKVACILTPLAKSTVSGRKPCWPKNCEKAIVCPKVRRRIGRVA